jgi:hypothetical protein
MKDSFDFLEPHRKRGPKYARYGAFQLRSPWSTLAVIAGDGGGWDHVSVQVLEGKRTPTWAEMCWVKDTFFYAHEAVMQLHPPQAEYVNNHPYVLHLWRPQDAKQVEFVKSLSTPEDLAQIPCVLRSPIPLPPKEFV